jgi:hypothetical protein
MHPLEREIWDAFRRPGAVPKLSREEISDLKWSLVSLDAESVKELLPIALVDEISCLPKDGDALVYLLDGNMSSRGTRDRATMLASRRQVLETFTREQSRATLKWLEEVASSKYRKLCPSDLASAIAYWLERCA